MNADHSTASDAFPRMIEEFIDRSRFFQRWTPGVVTRQIAQRFLVAFDQLVASFPALIAAGISRLGEGGRVILAKNLFEECGEGHRDRTHHAIYRRYLETAGIDWKSADVHEPTVAWRERLRHHTLTEDPAEAVGVIAAGEFLAQPALTRIFEVLRPIYAEADVAYFTSHLQLETEHVREISELIALQCKDGSRPDGIARGFSTALDSWNAWFEAVATDLFDQKESR